MLDHPHEGAIDLQLSRPSIGRLTNQILKINPSLGVTEIISIIRSCTTSKSVPFGSGQTESGLRQVSEEVDEARAIELARASLTKTQAKN